MVPLEVLDRITLNGQTVIANAELPGLSTQSPIGLEHLGNALAFTNRFVEGLV